jgi:hypothetical protein
VYRQLAGGSFENEWGSAIPLLINHLASDAIRLDSVTSPDDYQTTELGLKSRPDLSAATSN